MTEVLIVDKTKTSSETYSVGGIQLDSLRSLRLFPPTRNDHPMDTPLDIGQVWEFTLQEMSPAEIMAPHVEDIRVIGAKKLRTMSFDQVKAFVLENIGAPIVHPKDLFYGRLQYKQSEKKRITPDGGIPLKSTGFWRLDIDLILQEVDNRARYICIDHNDGRTIIDIPFVGEQAIEEVIPAETLLRLSLSRWFNEGYWLQLSGWFI